MLMRRPPSRRRQSPVIDRPPLSAATCPTISMTMLAVANHNVRIGLPHMGYVVSRRSFRVPASSSAVSTCEFACPSCWLCCSEEHPERVAWWFAESVIILAVLDGGLQVRSAPGMPGT
jgi:hypothetical protein